LKISGNQFAKHVFNKSIGTWSNTVSVSSNSAVKKVFKRGMDKWSGANTSELAFGAQDAFGGVDSTFGTSMFEGQAHFKLRTDYTVSH